jgi:tagatose-6-phosphate ketose/aldose isomerase
MLTNTTNKEGQNTSREILHQPAMWLREYDLIYENRKSIETFLTNNNISRESEIILTGAGTSAYIGNSLTFILPLKGYMNCKAVPTTELITHPESFFSPEKSVVLVSFARSGNSPESLAAVELADKTSKKAVHIIITCNKHGELAKKSHSNNSLLLLLPPETNDISLAMTSSFSTMLLSFMLLINIREIEAQHEMIKDLSRSATNFMQHNGYLIEKIASLNFKRAVFLGSGELKGIAEECHLKLQELTDGKVICKFDTFLGFRHGPKAVIDKDTLIVYLFSTNDFVRQYEKDLVKQINNNNHLVAQIAVSAGKPLKVDGVKYDLELIMEHSYESTNEYSLIPYVLIGQLIGFYKSLSLGLDPDNPSVSGNIARVVEGVTIYNNYKNA